MAGKEKFSNLFKEREYGYWGPLYDFGRIFCTVYFRAVMNVDVKGSKHVPREGPFVIYSNHMTAYDPPMLGHSFSRKTHYMGREELFTHRLCRQFGFSKLIRLLGCFPVNRENPSSLTLKIIKEIVSQDEGFIMFPQGTRKHGKN
ncbi:hypothetical protein GF371_00340, partial [Candidatus Woesearchaeota archaeon]|nr:hypothetical protein [Candidatus Woesearchaeota archaeon]